MADHHRGDPGPLQGGGAHGGPAVVLDEEHRLERDHAPHRGVELVDDQPVAGGDPVLVAALLDDGVHACSRMDGIVVAVRAAAAGRAGRS